MPGPDGTKILFHGYKPIALHMEQTAQILVLPGDPITLWDFESESEHFLLYYEYKNPLAQLTLVGIGFRK